MYYPFNILKNKFVLVVRPVFPISTSIFYVPEYRVDLQQYIVLRYVISFRNEIYK